MVEGSLNNYITNGFLNFHNQFLSDFLIINSDWYYPIDENFESQLYLYIDNQENIFEKIWSYIFSNNINVLNKYNSELYLQNYIYLEIVETLEITNSSLYLYDYNYKLLFIENDYILFIKNIINNNYIYYLNVSFYINVIYIFADFFIELKLYLYSIIITIINIKNFIYYYLFKEIIDINYFKDFLYLIDQILTNWYIEDISNNVFLIFYDFLDHCTYKITIIYYIYILYFFSINVIFLLVFKKIISIIYYLKFQIININIFLEYISILNLNMNLNLQKFNLNIKKFNFKLAQNPNSTIFFILLFIKRIKNLYFIRYILEFNKYLMNILINTIKYLYIIFLSIIKYILSFVFFFGKKLKTKFILDKDNIYFVKQKNPFLKFFFDRDRFKIKKFSSKEDKQYYDLIKKQQENEILSTYWKYLQVFYYSYTYIMFVRFIRIILFLILFIFRFLIFKFLKNIVNMWILNKTMYIFIYYILNIYLYLKIIMRHVYLKYIWYLYFKVKNNIVYYLNMFIHYKLFKFITRLFLQESSYLNAEMIDKFPYYSSKYIRNFFVWFDVMIIKNRLKINLLNIKIIIKYLYNFIFSKIILFFIILLPFSINKIYYILSLQIKIYNIIINNKNNNNFLLLIKVLLLFLLIKIILLFYCHFIIYTIIIFSCYIIHYIIISYNNNLVNNIIWYLGFYLFFFYDILFKLLKKILFFLIKITKYFVIYPFIIYLIIFFFINNPIIYIKFTYILKLFILPLFNIILYIINDLNNFLTISIFFDSQEIISYNQNNIFNSIDTINDWLVYADGIYWEIWESVNYWWIYKEINYNIFLYYTPFDYLWFEGFYAFEEIYNIYKYITHYFFLYIYISIIYYFWSVIYLISKISYIFIWINYLTINEFIFYYIYISKIIYFALLKIYIYDYIYIYIPYYIIQPIYNIYILYYEYYFIIKFMGYFSYFLYTSNIIKIYVLFFYNNIIIENIYIFLLSVIINIKNIIYIFIYIFINIVKYISIIIYIYIYLISDIIYNMNLIFIIRYLYIYINIDFFLFDKYSKIVILKDSFYSSFRFPIEYYNRLNINRNYHKYFQKNYFWIKKERFEFLADMLTFDYSKDNLVVGRWKKKTLTVWSKFYISHYNDNLPKWYLTFNGQSNYNIKYLYFSYKIFKFRKLLILFPYISSLFAIYYILVFIISFYFIIKLYTFLFNHEHLKNKELYVSNNYAWDVLRKKIIDNNYKLIKKNNNDLYNYYYKQIMINKDYNNNNILNIKKDNNIKKKYISFYINYIIIKDFIKKLSNKKYYNNLNKYKSKFKLLLKLKSKFFNFNNFMKKITFDFRDLIIFKKYNLLYNVMSNEEKKFSLFSTYTYNNYKYMPFIYNHYYEEPFIDGSIKFYINKNNYNYFYNKLQKLYFFYKWIDKIFLNNKGSFYLFHKDPRVPFISKDFNNNTFYYNTSMDYDNQIYILFVFIAIPFIITSTFLSSILHFTNEMDYQFYDIFYMHLTFWLSWFMTQFSIFYEGILKIIFSFMGDSIYMFALDNDEENILSHGDIEFHNWFNYEIRTKKIFPLYNYYYTKYYLFQIFSLSDNINMFKLLILNIKYNILYLYDILYSYSITFFNFYNLELIIYNILRTIIIIIMLIYIYIFDNNIIKFYKYKKFSINLIKFSYTLKNLYLVNINNILKDKEN